MREITLIIGGCKSGKSRQALEAANRHADVKKIFIATSVPFDEEMKKRVDRHRLERGNDWTTVEAPVHLADAIKSNCGDGCLIVVDCLTLWINNLLMETQDDAVIEKWISELIRTLDRVNCPIYLVSNEVGAGIVPENPLARQFRDLAGNLNQLVASIADRVVWMVAGIAVQVK